MSESNMSEIAVALEEAESLIWGLLDENIATEGIERLEKLLNQPEVRARYVECVELHAGLKTLFAEDAPTEGERPRTPVLGFLADGFEFPGTKSSTGTPLSE